MLLALEKLFYVALESYACKIFRPKWYRVVSGMLGKNPSVTANAWIWCLRKDTKVWSVNLVKPH